MRIFDSPLSRAAGRANGRPTVLLAWELGSGLGHVMTLRRLATRLARRRWRLVAAVKDLTSAQALAAYGIEVLQAPIWPFMLAENGQCAPISSASLGDMLAGFGLADEPALRMLLLAWDHLLALVRPDLIVADYAPAVSLVARGRVPVILVGNGFTLPPDRMEKFPLLHRITPPVWEEAEILDSVNRALKAIAASPLDRLPQVFAADARSVQSFTLLDPYHSYRAEPLDGPIVEPRPAAREPDARTIFAYLRQQGNLRPAAVEALLPFADRLRVFGSGVTAEQAAELVRRGAQIESAPPPLASALASARLFVHLGGTSAAGEAIAAGVPQLVLSVDIEKDLNGRALEQAGIGRLIKIYDPAAELSSELIESMVQDERMAAQAAELGECHRTLLQQRDPLSRVEYECLNLMGERVD